MRGKKGHVFDLYARKRRYLPRIARKGHPEKEHHERKHDASILHHVSPTGEVSR
jgi:hypothetical protein